ncbi:MAG: DUF151 domain-containing protein [Persephonella sp.]|nr:DUF151 domain-containing protein [Persephonella sp.]
MKKDGEEITIDARPSDAINIALRFDAPIYVDEQVVQKVSMSELLKGQQDKTAEIEGKTEENVDKELEEFKKMLENIKPEDFALKPEDKKEG